MNNQQFLDVIYTHTEGEPTCIVHGGIPYPFGGNILDKRHYLQQHHDHVRTSLMREPRGHQHMFGVFLTPPSDADHDAGMLWIDGEQFVDMCGHGTIALSMAMVAHRLAPPPREDGLTRIRFETTAGTVVSEVKADADKVHWTRFENVPAFVMEQDIPVEVPGLGTLKADLVFGGNFFAIIRVPSDKQPICPENGSYFSHAGQAVKAELNARMEIRHPTHPHINGLNFVTFWHEGSQSDSLYRNVHVFSDGKLDRSPGGTGTSAMMAMFHARNELEVGRPIHSEGLLGSGRFTGEILGETEVGGYRAIRPSVQGTAELIGYAKWLIDARDPVGRGFVIR
ncbi:proline racemase family protein [Halomonas sp. MCCC 1A11062]|uniref:proline racemase family protein n=1 Tax=Halomonas sp. MCCC 1A11062 TaxID=2733485 RepID=UPI001F165E95|nr:proline racemase family protein [Halomonas sp. MCCC 1A11062]MCE8039540.1 proline racemase [Halomonas sp. MCCC 1A11062]